MLAKEVLEVRDKIISIALEAINLNAKFFKDELYEKKDLFEYRVCSIDFNNMVIRVYSLGALSVNDNELSREGEDLQKRYKDLFSIYYEDRMLYIVYEPFSTVDSGTVKKFISDSEALLYDLNESDGSYKEIQELNEEIELYESILDKTIIDPKIAA